MLFHKPEQYLAMFSMSYGVFKLTESYSETKTDTETVNMKVTMDVNGSDYSRFRSWAIIEFHCKLPGLSVNFSVFVSASTSLNTPLLLLLAVILIFFQNLKTEQIAYF